MSDGKPEPRFCYKCYGLNDFTCYLPKGHEGECGALAARPANQPTPAQEPRKEYKHFPTCNGDRRVPAGEPGHSCLCFNDYHTNRAISPDLRERILGLSWIPLNFRHDVLRIINAELAAAPQPTLESQHDGPCYEEGVIEGLEFAARLVDRFKETKLDLSPVAAEIRKLKSMTRDDLAVYGPACEVIEPFASQKPPTLESGEPQCTCGVAEAESKYNSDGKYAPRVHSYKCPCAPPRVRETEYQRGAQEMAEKAAQHWPSKVDTQTGYVIQCSCGWRESSFIEVTIPLKWQNHIRSLAGAAKPEEQSEKWNDPALQKIADERDERLRRADIISNLAAIVEHMPHADEKCYKCHGDHEACGHPSEYCWRCKLNAALAAAPPPRASLPARDPGCICYGNWRLIISEVESLFGRQFKGPNGELWRFFGLVHSQDDYYYGMSNCATGRLSLLTCVTNFSGHDFTLVPEGEEIVASQPRASLSALVAIAESYKTRIHKLTAIHSFPMEVEDWQRDFELTNLRAALAEPEGEK